MIPNLLLIIWSLEWTYSSVEKLEVKQVKSPSLLGSDWPLTYTGEGKGGPCPYEEEDLLRSSLPPLYIVVSESEDERVRQQFFHFFPRFLESLLYTIYNIYMTAPPQHKQRYYYIFWSIATLAVVCGQIYVASSYHSMANALSKLLWSITWINMKRNC